MSAAKHQLPSRLSRGKAERHPKLSALIALRKNHRFIHHHQYTRINAIAGTLDRLQWRFAVRMVIEPQRLFRYATELLRTYLRMTCLIFLVKKLLTIKQ